MRVELRQLQRKLGITAIYVTHDQEDANADRRQHRGARPGPHPADRHADRALRPPGQPLRRDLPRHRQPDRGHDRSRTAASSPTGLRCRVSRRGRARPASRSARRIFPSGPPEQRHCRHASPSASSSAASRATTRRPARSRSWSMCRTGAARKAHEVGETIGLIIEPSQVSVLQLTRVRLRHRLVRIDAPEPLLRDPAVEAGAGDLAPLAGAALHRRRDAGLQARDHRGPDRRRRRTAEPARPCDFEVTIAVRRPDSSE